jgi:hypothetical protein
MRLRTAEGGEQNNQACGADRPMKRRNRRLRRATLQINQREAKPDRKR